MLNKPKCADAHATSDSESIDDNTIAAVHDSLAYNSVSPGHLRTGFLIPTMKILGTLLD